MITFSDRTPGRRRATECRLATKRLCIIGIAALAMRPLHADQDVTFNSIGLDMGLSQSTAQCLLIDSRGLLWIGTQSGLNLYDGANVSVFRCDNADSTTLSNDDVISLCEDSTGAIWVGTRYGLNRFDIRTASFRRMLCDSTLRDGMPHNHVGALAAGSVLWVGTRNGIARLDPATGRWLPRPEVEEGDSALIGAPITAFCVCGDTVWAGTGTRKLFALDNSGTVIARRVMPESSPPHHEGLHTLALFADSRHRLLAAERSSGVYIIDPAADTLTPLDDTLNRTIREQEFLVTCIAEDAECALWIGTYGGGLLRLRDGDLAVFHTGHGECGPPSNHYFSLCAHASGILFAGSMDHGVVTVRSDLLARLVPRCGPHESLSGAVVTSLCTGREGTLWVGLMDGLDRVELCTGRVTTIRQVEGEEGVLNLANIYYLHEDEGGLLVGGYPMGLVRISPSLRLYERVATTRMVGGAALGESGELWIAALNEGIWRVDWETGAEQRYLHDDASGLDLRGRMVFEVMPVGADLWIGTSDGLFRFNPETRTTTAFSEVSRGGLPDPEILFLLYSGRSGLWVGTSGGLARHDEETDRLRSFTVRDGLSSSAVFSCLEDDQGSLWLGTTDGLVRLDPSSGGTSAYGVGDGLPSREFNQGAAASGPDGRLFFGTMKGVVVFHPDSVQRPDRDIPVLITSLSSDALRIRAPAGWPGGETIHLGAESRDVNFRFVGIDYRDPSQVRYRALLEGYDRMWRDIGTVPSVSYTRLPPGHYTLRVRSGDTQGHGGHEARLAFVITPRLPEQVWFRLLAGAVGVGCLVGLYYFRMQTIRKQRDQLRREVEARTQELAMLASTDSLTGVATRRHFMERAAREVVRFREEGVRLCMLMVDIDHFKHINDTYGHAVGDATLQAMAASLRHVVRQNDLIGRLGGDEFAVMLPGAGLPQAMQVAERIRSEVTHTDVEGTPRPASFTVSIGVASLQQESDDVGRLLLRADEAMYEAKNAGRNRVVVETST